MTSPQVAMGPSPSHTFFGRWWSLASSRAHGDPRSLFGLTVQFHGPMLKIRITNISSATTVRGLSVRLHGQTLSTAQVLHPQQTLPLEGISSGLYTYAADHASIPVSVSWTVRSLRVPLRLITRTHTFISPLVDGDLVAPAD